MTVPVIGMLRVRNEARWIREVIEAALQICERIFVLDDHSTDETVSICEAIPGVEVFHSPLEGLDEARDKTWLLNRVRDRITDCWVLCIDGDEVLLQEDVPLLREALATAAAEAFALRVLYAWDHRNQIRMDGIYGRFWRGSLFRVVPGRELSFKPTRADGKGISHSGNTPGELRQGMHHLEVRLLHFGYLHQEDRLRKFAWYNQVDPQNDGEDCYQHMVMGDPGGPPASVRTKHAGPLELRPL